MTTATPFSICFPSSNFSNRTFLQIGALVVLLHVILIGSQFFWFQSLPVPAKRTKVVVQTVQLTPTNPMIIPQTSQVKESLPIVLEPTPVLPVEAVPPIATIPAPEPIPAPKPNPATIAKPPVKQEIKKPQVVKKEKPISTTAPAKPQAKSKPVEDVQKQQKAAAELKKKEKELAAAQEAKLKQQEKLAQARESLAKIGDIQKQTNQVPLISLNSQELPQLIGSLAIDHLPISATPLDSQWGLQESRYQDRLVTQLESSLRLPEYGTVQLKLTLKRSGEVMNVQVIKSENSKNQAYIERTLSTLSFSPFGNEFEGLSTYTFTITLRNKTS